MLRWSRKSRSSSLLRLLRLALPAAFAAERRWLPGRGAPFEEPAAVSTTNRTIMASPRRAARWFPIAERKVSPCPRSLYSRRGSSRKTDQASCELRGYHSEVHEASIFTQTHNILCPNMSIITCTSAHRAQPNNEGHRFLPVLLGRCRPGQLISSAFDPCDEQI